MDTTTSTGRLARGVLAEFAAFEAERIGDTWKEAHERRVRQGLPATGKPRFGYRYVDKHFEPDPVTGPILAQLYRRYLAGESVYSLVRWLKDEGIRTVDGYRPDGPGPWSDRSLRRVLDSGFGAGYFTHRGQQVRGAHEPVITETEWKAYLAARAGRRNHRGTERSQYLLSGLVRCSCGSRMTGGQFGSQRQPKYRCKAAHEQARHAGGYALMSYVEAAVMDWLREIGADVQAQTDAALATASRARRRAVDATSLAREINRLDAQLTKLTIQHAAEVVPERAYLAARDELLAEHAALSGRLADAEAEAARTVPAGAIAGLLEKWDELSVELRRAELQRWIQYVEVTPGRPRAEIRVIPLWEG